MKTNLALFLSLFIGHLCFAQKSINSAGGDISIATGSISYSIGQVFFTSNSASSGSINLGVQQPSEFFPLNTATFDVNTSSVFPNPTSGKITVKFSDFSNEEYQYIFSDINGKQLQKGIINSKESTLNIYNFKTGVYFLKLINYKSSSFTYKIVKN